MMQKGLYKRNSETPKGVSEFLTDGASDEARTRYLHLGKVALYQMSYTRISKIYLITDWALVKVFLCFFRNLWVIYSASIPASPAGGMAWLWAGKVVCPAAGVSRGSG